MKIYISTKFQDIKIFNKISKICEEIGINYFNWTQHKNYKKISDKEKLKQAQEDIHAIDNCDLFILVFNGVLGKGMMFELGYAYAKNKPIVIYDIKRNISEQSQFISIFKKNIITDENELKNYLLAFKLKN
jgi:nucleoside 2-deoxyribosyltransferase